MTRVALMAPALRVPEAYRHDSRYLFERCGGNTGNFAFVNALATHITSPLAIVEWSVDAALVRERYDAVVFAASNQLGRHVNLEQLAKKFEEIQLPTVVIGLGAQANLEHEDLDLPEGTERWVRILHDLAPNAGPNIGVRGTFTKKVLDKYIPETASVVMGCPSNFLNPDPHLGEALESRFSCEHKLFAVAAGLEKWSHLRSIEQSLVGLVDGSGAAYITQSELAMIQMARTDFTGMAAETLVALRDYIKPGLDLEDFKLWCRVHATCFIDATSWMEHLRRFDFVVGPRFHGVMLGLQAGVPGGCIAHDSRTFELCSTMGVPVVTHRQVINGISKEQVRGLFKFDREVFSSNRKAFAKAYIDILSAAGIQTQAYLSGLSRA
jgi:hypothetical protein